MIFLAFALIVLCGLVYRFVIFAMPVVVGFAVCSWAARTGAGFGAIFIGVIAGAIVFGLCQAAFHQTRSKLLRGVAVFLFVAPAAAAAYGLVLSLAKSGGATSLIWPHVMAAFGALIIGITAFGRLDTQS
jgi:hypothetical protein